MIITIIITMWISGLVLRFYYYGILHVWRNTILSGKKLIRREMEKSKNETIDEEIQTKFFRYVFVTRSTWFCGALKHIEMTVLILPGDPSQTETFDLALMYTPSQKLAHTKLWLTK